MEWLGLLIINFIANGTHYYFMMVVRYRTVAGQKSQYYHSFAIAS